MLLIKKYGGSSVSTPEKILDIAKKLKSHADEGHQLIVIVSAMGGTTNNLIKLSRRITQAPVQRELDMLLSSGERISMALMAMALHSLGCKAISFTGSQSGVLTNSSHNNARIIDIKPTRVNEELAKRNIVIIAGFQGVDPQSKEITTLGRGGSDTTAVAMAAHFKADRCDILTDVKGIYSIDPRTPATIPHHFEELDYQTALDMTYWGAQVLNYRSVELAQEFKVPVLVHLSSEEGRGTLVKSMEATSIHTVNHNPQIALLSFHEKICMADGLNAIHGSILDGKLPAPQIIYQRKPSDFFLSTPQEIFYSLLASLIKWCKKNDMPEPHFSTHFGTIALTGKNLVNSQIVFEASALLKQNQILPEGLITSPNTVSFIIEDSRAQHACQLLHKKFVESRDTTDRRP